MCVNPVNLPTGATVGCRKCWQCKENRVNDWVGRCIAESRHCTAARSITLTYGGDNKLTGEKPLEAKVLLYSDVQKYFKRLRRAGYKFKYFAVGEYGTVKGRAHWHIMIYFSGRKADGSPAMPAHELGKRFKCEYWSAGFSHWEEPTPAAIRYVCKYVLKDVDDEAKQGHLAMSKKPPLGHEYFQRLADLHVEQGLAPQDLFYSFDEARDKNGEKIKFLMTGVTADNFLRRFVDRWQAVRGTHLPNSVLVEEWLDAQVTDWRLPEKIADAERKAIKRETDPVERDREQFRKEHYDWYFGAEARKLWSGTE